MLFISQEEPPKCRLCTVCWTDLEFSTAQITKKKSLKMEMGCLIEKAISGLSLSLSFIPGVHVCREPSLEAKGSDVQEGFWVLSQSTGTSVFPSVQWGGSCPAAQASYLV